MTYNAFLGRDDPARHALACSLLDEALALWCRRESPVAPQPTPRERRPGQPGPLPYWNTAHVNAALRAFVAREGRVPTRQEWRETKRLSLPSRETVRLVYGSLEAAYLANGLAWPASRRGKQKRR